MGIKGLGVAPLAGGTQRPVLQCIAMKLHSGIARHCTALHGIARDWRARQDAAVWCPLSPPLSLLPRNPTNSHWRDRLFVRPRAYFPHLTGTQPPFYSLQKLQARARALNSKYIQCQAEPTQLPSLHPNGAVAERSN